MDKIWILDCKKEEIKPNEWASTPNADNAFCHGFEAGKQAVLAHAHEIDIDEKLKEWDTTRFLKEYRQQTFSQFLESEIKRQEEKGC